MANGNGNKYGRNRNLWRRVYGFRRRKPEKINLVDANTNVSFSLDLQSTFRHRDFYLIKSAKTASVVTPPGVVLAEYDEDVIWFINSDTETDSFNFTFSDVPDAVVLSMEPADNNTNNVIPYGFSFTSSSLTVGLSAPFSGSIRYRAVYSPNSYPATVTSSLVPASGTFKVSAGHVTASSPATSYTSSYSSPGSFSHYLDTAWDFFGNLDVNVSIQDKTANATQTTAELTAPVNNPIYFIAFYDT